MQLVIVNLTGSTKTYLSGAVSVPGNSSTSVTNTVYQLALATDGTLHSDIVNVNVNISDGTTAYGNTDALTYLKLITFNLGPISDGTGSSITSTTIGSKQALDVNAYNIEAASGTIAGTGQSIVSFAGGTVLVEVTGTWSGTINVSGNIDGSAYGLFVSAINGASPLAYTYATITSNGVYKILLSGANTAVTVQGGTWTSGTATITINSAPAVTLSEIVQLNQANLLATVYQGGSWTVTATNPSVTFIGNPPPAQATYTAGSVTTTAPSYTTGQLQGFSLNTSGGLRVDGSGSTQPVSGTVTSNQGTPNTQANAWYERITDGTNGPVAVKPASTSPLSTDIALVVALSPNSSPLSASTGNGTISVLNGNVIAPSSGAITWSLSGTWVGTLTTQAQNGDGQWWNVASLSNQSGSITNSTTVNGVLEMNAAGWTQARIIATAWTSGTVTVTYASTNSTHLLIPYSSNPANMLITSYLNDGSGNSLSSTSGALNAFLTNTTIAVTQAAGPWAIQGDSASGVSKAGNPVQIGGVFNTTQPTVTAGQTVEAQSTARGAFIVATGVDNFNINNIVGTISLPTGAATSANQTTEIASLQLIDNPVGPVSAGTAGTASFLIGGVFNTALPTLTNTQQAAIQVDSSGRIITSPSKSSVDNNGSGTIAALNGTVVATTNGCSSVTFDVTGTWVATITIEATAGDGNWFIVNGDVDTTNSITSSFTINTFVTIPCGSFPQVRLRASAYTSGTTNITWNAGVGSNIVEVFNTNPASLATTTRLNDASGNAIAAINNQLETRDVLNVSFQYRAQSITTSAAEALGGATILANRKLLHITPTNGTIYWGYNSSVTTTTGSPLFPNNTLWLSVTDNVHVYIIAGTTVDSRIGELS